MARQYTIRLTATFGACLLAARAAVLVARAGDGLLDWPASISASPGWLFGVAGPDVLVLGLVLLADLAAQRLPRATGTVLWLFAALAMAYTALNVVSARVLGSPITAPMLDGAGGELGDSVRYYLTPYNVLLLGIPLIAASVAWLRSRPWTVSGRTGLIAALAMVGAGWISNRLPSARTVAGENALLTLGRTLAAERLEGSDWLAPESLGLDTLPALPPTDDPSYVGVAAWKPGSTQRVAKAADLARLSATAKGWNVIWVILESTGARYLGAYRGDPDPMPALSRIASESSLIFDRAYTAYPESVKGLIPTLCGVEPAAYTAAVRYRADHLGCDSLPALLKSQGYSTAIFHSGWFRYLGLGEVVAGRGFDHVADAGVIGGEEATSFGTTETASVDSILQTLDGLPPDQPAIVMYLNIAGHHPYDAPGDGPRAFGESDDLHRYLSDLHTADDAIARLWDGVAERETKGRRPTLWVFVGDHGQAFQQHPGNIAHSLFLYEENVHVPLIVRMTGAIRPTMHLTAVTGVIDLAPTVLDLLGVGIPPSWVGRSALQGGEDVARFYTDHTTWQVGLRQGRWKFIHDLSLGESQLYDLVKDPGEQANVAESEPARADAYRRYAAEWSNMTRRRVLSR